MEQSEITREQVERAIDACERGQGGIVIDVLGTPQVHWQQRVPSYVRDAWVEGGLLGCVAALTRWRDELAAAEPVRRVARWDADLEAYTLTPTHDDGALMTHAVEDAAKARAWGYTIEGGPEPIDDTAPERLRERREAVVDVPQPRQPIVKRCGGVAASWQPDGTCLFIDGGAASVHAPLALLRAMLEAIDAQQGGAS